MINNANNSIKNKIQGIIPGLPTPLTENRKIDNNGLEKLVKHVLKGGVHGLFLHGSISESVSFTPEELYQVVEICVSVNDNRVPIIAGISDNDIRQVLKNADEIKKRGADACFAVVPFYFTLTPSEAIKYFQNLASKIPLPLIIYNNPFSTNLKLDLNVFKELIYHPNIIGIKDSSADFILFQELLISLPNRQNWTLLIGDDRLTASGLLLGGDGAVVAWANIYPEMFIKLYSAIKTGDILKSFKLQEQICALDELFKLSGPPTDGSFISGVKAALEIIGICGRTVMNPFDSVPNEKMGVVRYILESCKQKVMLL